MQISPLHFQLVVRFEMHLQKKIPCRRTADPRRSLPGQTDELTFAHAFGNFHAEGPAPQLHSALGVHAWHPQRKLTGDAGKGVLQVQQHLLVVIHTA
ncbi:hypothetical protein D3C72_2232430 [compost metagenome]